MGDDDAEEEDRSQDLGPASLPSRNAVQHFTRATLYGNLQEKCRAPECAQNADEHFVRACAVETHVKMSQKCRAPE